ILKQNDQLHKIDEKLEQMVNTRTHDLETENNMLALSNAILEDLPIAVVGIDIEGIIVSANKVALKKLCHRNVEIGRPFGDFFNGGAADNVRHVFKTGATLRIALQEADGTAAAAALSPLSGPFKDKAVIMTIK
ncbi:MAG: PAS domain-containing protein, partial [Desulfobacteraceae bacterium]